MLITRRCHTNDIIGAVEDTRTCLNAEATTTTKRQFIANSQMHLCCWRVLLAFYFYFIFKRSFAYAAPLLRERAAASEGKVVVVVVWQNGDGIAICTAFAAGL